MGCVRQADRPSETLYDALIECHSSSLLYVCSCCRRQGPLPKRFLQLELERARASEERLAIARLLQERDAKIRELRERINELVAQQTALQGEMLTLTRDRELMTVKLEQRPTTGIVSEVRDAVEHTTSEHDPIGGTSASGSESDSSSSSHEHSTSSRRGIQRTDPYPPGFHALINRVSKFSGDKGAGDFETWLEDFVEATEDCSWDNKNRAK